jgi:non-canonical (house-cleaning) NTP pyrophosphatase
MAKIVCATSGSNVNKTDAIRKALERRFGCKVDVLGYSIKTTIPEQPLGRIETFVGATHRARLAYEQASADPNVGDRHIIAVGIESGIYNNSDWTHVVVYDGDQAHEATSRPTKIPADGIDLLVTCISDQSKTFGARYAERTGAKADNWHEFHGGQSRYKIIEDAVTEALMFYEDKKL